MAKHSDSSDDGSYSVGAAVRITGLSEHLLRAWERRYEAIAPSRTPGGTRRYRESDIERLKLLKAGVEAGHPISELARLPDAEIERRVWAARPQELAPLDEALQAVERLDVPQLERILGTQFAALGPTGFARSIAAPLLGEIGARWERGELSIAAEHSASSVTRNLLGAALRSPATSDGQPRLVFATPAHERHEFGVLIAALTAVGAGANVLYLGPDLPASEVARAAESSKAAAVVLGVVALESDAASAYLDELADALPADVEIWVGGAAAGGLAAREGVVQMQSFDDVERRLSRLR